MKKALCQLLCVSLICISFYGCGQSNVSEASSQDANGDASVSSVPESNPSESTHESVAEEETSHSVLDNSSEPQPSSTESSSDEASISESEGASSEPASSSSSAEASPNESSMESAVSSADVIPEGYSKVPPLNTVQSFFTRNPAGYTYVGKWLDFSSPYYVFEAESPLGKLEQKIMDALAAFEGLEPANEELPITDNEFLLWTVDGVRHVYGTSRGGYLIADGKTYILPVDKQETIQGLHDFLLLQSNAQHASLTHTYPQWLMWMTPSKIQEIIFHSPVRGPVSISPNLLKHAAGQATLIVKPNSDSTYKLGSVDFSGDDVFHLEIRFNGGVVYHIYAKSVGYEGDYYVESSDMSFGCKYRLMLTSIDGAAQFLINEYEYIADAKTEEDVMNPAT